MSDCGLTIKQVKTRAVMAPLRRPITTAVAAIPSAPLVLIDLETQQGIVGRAYIFGYTPLTLRPLLIVFEELSEMLAGKPIAPAARYRDFEAAFRLLGR